MHIGKLERIQERALRAVYCDKGSSYDKLLDMANLSTLQNRRLQDIAILMYKVKNNLSPNYICSLFQIPQLKYTLRNNDFGIPRFNTVKVFPVWISNDQVLDDDAPNKALTMHCS